MCGEIEAKAREMGYGWGPKTRKGVDGQKGI